MLFPEYQHYAPLCAHKISSFNIPKSWLVLAVCSIFSCVKRINLEVLQCVVCEPGVGLGSSCEIGQQLYKELGTCKLNSVNFQSVPADEAQNVDYGIWRLDATRSTQEQIQAKG